MRNARRRRFAGGVVVATFLISALRLRTWSPSLADAQIPLRSVAQGPAAAKRSHAYSARRSARADPRGLSAGDRVQAIFPEDGEWHAGTVCNVNADGTVYVERGDSSIDDDEQAIFFACERDQVERLFVDYKVGDAVEAFFTEDGNWYPGTLATAYHNGSFEVQWDAPDGKPDRSLCSPELMMKLEVFVEYRVGDRVEAEWDEDGAWYPGMVANDHGDGTFEVAWDDPDGGPATSTCKPARMRKVAVFTDYQANDRVEAVFAEDGVWYAGVVTSKNVDGSFDVRWDDPDGGPEFSACQPGHIRRLQDVSYYRENDRVDAIFPDDGKRYAGVVEKANPDGTFHVRWDDADGGPKVSVCSAGTVRLSMRHAQEIMADHGLSPGLLQGDLVEHAPELLDGVHAALQLLQNLGQPSGSQIPPTMRRTCAVCGAAAGTRGIVEEVFGEREQPWRWWPPGMQRKLKERLRSCGDPHCVFALSLGCSWRRLAQQGFDSGRADDGVRIGVLALGLGVKVFEGSYFHYLVVDRLQNSPELHDHAVSHLQRMVAARPGHLRATMDLHFLCSRVSREMLSEGARIHLLPEVRAHYLRSARSQLPGSIDLALERAILHMLEGEILFAILQVAVARQHLPDQTLGAAMNVLIERSAVADLDVLTDKSRLALLSSRDTPPSVVLQLEGGESSAADLADAIRHFVASFGLEDRDRWVLKEVGEECGQGMQELRCTAGELPEVAGSRLEQLHRQSVRKRKRWVLQHLISPWLAPGGFKVSIRVYLLVTVQRGAVGLRAWLYQRGFVNVALMPYAAGGQQSVIIHGFTGTQRLLESFPEAEQWFPQIRRICDDLVRTAQGDVLKGADDRQDGWSLLGVDLMPDNDGRIWLLEVNAGPLLFVPDSPFNPSADAAALTRAMLLDVVDLRVCSLSGGKPNEMNGWGPLLGGT